MITYDQIKPYIENKLVSEQSHPENSDVRIFNYTHKAQFDKAWDDVTMQCRGLIMNIRTGEILARPFKKFYNYEEHIDKGGVIPSEEPTVSEKFDGSLGILYALNGKSWIATRGSFVSDQATWATNWFRKALANENSSSWVKPGRTALFEILYPENRIVVNYDFSGLVHLATIDIETGLEVGDFWPSPFKMVTHIDCDDITKLKEKEEENKEGYVVYFPKADLRLKVKFSEYVRLHKLITGVSEIAIWEHLKDDNSLSDLLDRVPDEFYAWVKSVQNRLCDEAFDLFEKAFDGYLAVQNMFTRKEQALWILKNKKTLSGPIFSILDGDQAAAREKIWNMVRPSGSSKAQFKIDLDL